MDDGDEEIEYVVEEEEEEETMEEDPVVFLEPTGFQDNETIQILSDDDESEVPMPPATTDGKSDDKPPEKAAKGGLWDDADKRVFPPGWPEQRWGDDQTGPEDPAVPDPAEAAKAHEELQEEMRSDDEKGNKESKGTFKVGLHVQFPISVVVQFVF